MTPQEHCEAAAEERARAANAPRPSKGMQSGKATVDNRLRAERQMGADRHVRYAAEHEQAAAVAGGRCASRAQATWRRLLPTSQPFRLSKQRIARSRTLLRAHRQAARRCSACGDAPSAEASVCLGLQPHAARANSTTRPRGRAIMLPPRSRQRRARARRSRRPASQPLRCARAPPPEARARILVTP